MMVGGRHPYLTPSMYCTKSLSVLIIFVLAFKARDSIRSMSLLALCNYFKITRIKFW